MMVYKALSIITVYLTREKLSVANTADIIIDSITSVYTVLVMPTVKSITSLFMVSITYHIRFEGALLGTIGLGS